MSSAITTAVVGSLIDALFEPSGPSEEEIRQEQARLEAERQAAEARAIAEEERHQKLMGSLISAPESKRPAGASGIRLTALQPATRIEPSVSSTSESLTTLSTPIGSAFSDEEARAWMDNPETLFNAVWKPIPLGKPLTLIPVGRPACATAKQGCEIDTRDAPLAVSVKLVAPAAPSHKTLPETEDWKHSVALLRPPGCPTGRCEGLSFFLQAMAATETTPREIAGKRQFSVLDRLRKTGLVMLETLLVKVVGETSTPGKVAVLYYNIYDTTNSTFADAIKVVGYAGSYNPTAAPPELTPLAETASALAPMPLEDEPGKFDPAGFALDSGQMTRKLKEIWAQQR